MTAPISSSSLYNDVSSPVFQMSPSEEEKDYLAAERIEDFICPLSADAMRDPWSLVCGHTFEKEFLKLWVEAREPKCPTCRNVFKKGEMVKNFSMASAIPRTGRVFRDFEARLIEKENERLQEMRMFEERLRHERAQEAALFEERLSDALQSSHSQHQHEKEAIQAGIGVVPVSELRELEEKFQRRFSAMDAVIDDITDRKEKNLKKAMTAGAAAGLGVEGYMVGFTVLLSPHAVGVGAAVGAGALGGAIVGVPLALSVAWSCYKDGKREIDTELNRMRDSQCL